MEDISYHSRFTAPQFENPTRTIAAFCFSLAVLLFSASIAVAQPVHVEVAEYGVFAKHNSEIEPELPDWTSPTGLRKAYGGVLDHVRTTKTIPAVIGTHFGFSFRLAGQDAGTQIPLHYVFLYPAPGILNDKGQRVNQSEWDDHIGSGELDYIDYVFEHDWETVPGIWTMQVWSEGRLLTEMKFEVVKLTG